MFVGLLACVLFLLLLVTLGRWETLTWWRVFTYPLSVFGLWPWPQAASATSVRSNLMVVAAITLVGFTLAQLVIQQA